MDGFGEFLGLLYVVLHGSLMVYWPLQAVALIVTRGSNRMIGLGILAFTLLVFATLGEPGPNFLPAHVVVLVTLSNLALVGLMVWSVLLRRAQRLDWRH